MAVVTGNELGTALIRALGLDPAMEITSIAIETRCDDVARVRIERLITNEEASAISRALETYRLTKDEPA